MPPRINMAATINRGDSASPSSTTPPSAAIAGTDSWTMAAWRVLRWLSAAYQSTYPTPEVTAPDATARIAPRDVRSIDDIVNTNRSGTRTSERAKFDVVDASASCSVRPLME